MLHLVWLRARYAPMQKTLLAIMNTRFSIFALPRLSAALLVLHTTCVFVAHSKAAPFTDANWISMGALPGADNTVWAVVADDWGNVYIAGDFIVVGETRTGNIAKWNGSSWSWLSGAPNGRVRALAVSGSDLYAAGDFTLAGSSHIAKWNGTNWSALGSGVDSVVTALAVSGNDAYAGGVFTKAGGIPANRIAKWNGSNWSALGSGISGSLGYGFQVPPSRVSALVMSGSDLYVGGVFTNAGGSPAANIAKWDGNNWSALGPGISGPFYGDNHISALAVSGGEIYAGGSFSMAGGSPAGSIAKWNGTSWSALGSGVSGGVQALAVSRGDLYAGGYFSAAGGRPANYIAKWDGNNWHAFGGNGLPAPVSAIAVVGTKVYAGRHTWDGTNWSLGGSGLNASVHALAVSGSNVYAGGWYIREPQTPAAHIAMWNGTSWSALGSGVDDDVSALAVSGTDVYAGGWFTNAGGTAANAIAKWDGTNWSPLGSGVNGVVSALAVSGSDVYAGGRFTTAGGDPADYIAKWDGTNWSALGSARLNGYVYALATSGSDLYVGGVFSRADERWIGHVAKWDGTNWSVLGWNGSVYPFPAVYALAVSGNELYAGGSLFSVIGGNIAKWDGTNWSTLGFYGVDSAVRALASREMSSMPAATSPWRAGRIHPTRHALTWSYPLFPFIRPDRQRQSHGRHPTDDSSCNKRLI